LWLVAPEDNYTRDSLVTIKRAGVAADQIPCTELQRRYPQFTFDDIDWGLLEPDSGVLMAREAVQALAEQCTQDGVQYLQECVLPPSGQRRLGALKTNSGAVVKGGSFVFACGPWLPTLFPDVLKSRMFITRQEVFFFGTPPGSHLFTPTAMPVWLCLRDQMYGMPDLANRGVKIASDSHGPEFNPENDPRIATSEGLHAAQAYLGKRFPQFKHAPLLENRVCQYENTCNGDFLIDRHPAFENVWLVGGGSGHGFKHGPVVGEYTATLVAGCGAPEPRFTLDTKLAVQHRMVY
jgi:sarcosine oxidase